MTTIIRRTSRLLVLAALLVVASPPRAHAQFMMGGADANMMGQFKLPRKSIEAYAKVLGLDADQREAALALHEGYVQQHEALSKGFQDDMRKIQEEFEDTQDFTIFQKKMPGLGMDFQQKMEALEKGFLGDLRALLTPEQDVKWPKVERARLRETALRFSMVSGQGVDLVDVIGDLKIDAGENPDLADQLDRYELEMDKALRAFEKWGKDQQKQFMDDENAFDFSKMNEMMKKAEEMMKQMGELGRGIRDLNRQYARTILPTLPAAQQARFEHEVKRRSFPRVYKRSWVTEALLSARGLADLSADQRAQVAELESSYTRELAVANERWAAAITEREEKTGGSMVAMMQSMMGGGGGGNDPVSEARRARKELDERYKDKLSAVLTAEQRARLPVEKPAQAEQMDMFGMMPDTDLEGEGDRGP